MLQLAFFATADVSSKLTLFLLVLGDELKKQEIKVDRSFRLNLKIQKVFIKRFITKMEEQDDIRMKKEGEHVPPALCSSFDQQGFHHEMNSQSDMDGRIV